MHNYSKMTVKQLLELSDTNADAGLELLARQRSGKLVRMYRGPRRGAHDEGLNAVALMIGKSELRLLVGRSNRPMLFTDEMIDAWIDQCRRGLAKILLDYAYRGFTLPVIARRMQERETPLEIDSERVCGGVRLIFGPSYRTEWTMGLENCKRFVEALSVS